MGTIKYTGVWVWFGCHLPEHLRHIQSFMFTRDMAAIPGSPLRFPCVPHMSLCAQPAIFLTVPSCHSPPSCPEKLFISHSHPTHPTVASVSSSIFHPATSRWDKLPSRVISQRFVQAFTTSLAELLSLLCQTLRTLLSPGCWSPWSHASLLSLRSLPQRSHPEL